MKESPPLPSSPPRTWSFLPGAAMGALSSVALLVYVQSVNPWFLDAPLAFLLLFTLPASLVGAVLALPNSHRIPLGPLPWRVGLALAWMAVPALAAWPRPGPTGDTRILVFGLDGATFDLLDVFAPHTPHLAGLEKTGVRADLMSMEPMFSPLLWTTMATGKLPEEHGIHGFHVQYPDCRVPQFWEVLASRGWTLGIYKWLVTYPPLQAEGFMVPAWLASGPETWPPELGFVKEMELSRRLKRQKIAATRGAPALAWDGVLHGLRLGTLLEAARVSLTEKVQGPHPLRSQRDGQLLKVRMDRDVAVWAIHRWNPTLVTFTDYASDALSHKFWKHSDGPGAATASPAEVARWGGTLLDTYAQADRVLGDLMAAVGPQARVVVLSDHGFTAFDAGQGDAGRFWEPRTEALRSLLEADLGAVEVARMGHKLVVTPTGPEGSVQALQAALERLTLASTGQPFYRWEPVEGDAGSLGLTLRDESVTPEKVASDKVGDRPLGEFVSLTEPDSGVHHARGVFLASGPGLSAGTRLPPLGLLDVAPILLSMGDLPAGRDMAGRVPEGLYSTPPTLPQAPDSWDSLVHARRFVSGQQGVNEDALKALGYIE